MRTVILPKLGSPLYEAGGLIDIDCVKDEIRYKGKSYSYGKWKAFVSEDELKSPHDTGVTWTLDNPIGPVEP